jgi:hypothetical protein
VQNGATLHPLHAMALSERIRFTIAVDPEVHDAFSDMAEAAGVSLSRCIGDWLRDTSEAAQITTVRLNAARKAPQDAFRAFIRDGVAPEVRRLIENPQRRLSAIADRPGVAGAASGGRAVPPAQPGGGLVAGGLRRPSPPSSNTGGKSPGKTRGSR